MFIKKTYGMKNLKTSFKYIHIHQFQTLFVQYREHRIINIIIMNRIRMVSKTYEN